MWNDLSYWCLIDDYGGLVMEDVFLDMTQDLSFFMISLNIYMTDIRWPHVKELHAQEWFQSSKERIS